MCFKTDLDSTVEEAIVLSRSVEETFGVWRSEDHRRMFGHALLRRRRLVFTRHCRYRHRRRRHFFKVDISKNSSYVYITVYIFNLENKSGEKKCIFNMTSFR